MTAAWVFPPTAPFQVQGRDLSEDNFAQEDRSSLEILIREALQNTLDARSPDNTGPVKVRISVLGPDDFDQSYLASLTGGEFGTRLVASGVKFCLKFPVRLYWCWKTSVRRAFRAGGMIRMQTAPARTGMRSGSGKVKERSQRQAAMAGQGRGRSPTTGSALHGRYSE